MADFPYSPNSGDFSKVLDRIRNDRPPDRVEEKFLVAAAVPQMRWSYVTTSLRLLGFTDANGVPTQRWHDYRDPGKAQAVLAEAVREAFAPLFAENPEPYLLSNEDLTSVFAAKVPAARSTGAIITRSFRSLCKLAGLPTPSAKKAEPKQSKPKQRQREDRVGPVGSESPATSTVAVGAGASVSKGSVPITINIQLTLPETKEAEVYDLLFAALKKHLLSN